MLVAGTRPTLESNGKPPEKSVRGWLLAAGSERSVAGAGTGVGLGCGANSQLAQLGPAHFRAGGVYYPGPNVVSIHVEFRRAFHYPSRGACGRVAGPTRASRESNGFRVLMPARALQLAGIQDCMGGRGCFSLLNDKYRLTTVSPIYSPATGTRLPAHHRIKRLFP
jgi:hypothetical protein